VASAGPFVLVLEGYVLVAEERVEAAASDEDDRADHRTRAYAPDRIGESQRRDALALRGDIGLERAEGRGTSRFCRWWRRT
jgi:hypothetical protein